MTAFEQLTAEEKTECQTRAFRVWDNSFAKTFQRLRACLDNTSTGKEAFNAFIAEEQETIAAQILSNRSDATELLMV